MNRNEQLDAQGHQNTIAKFAKNISLMLAGSVAVSGLVVGFGLWRMGDRFFNNLQSLFFAPQPEARVDVQSIVVQQVRGVSELTTAVFAMQAVVPTSRDRTVGNYTIGKTTLLYIAYGEVKAGVDLATLDKENVRIEGDTVYLRLPPPEILDSKIDVTRSNVYDYDRGFLGLGPDVAPELQQLAQQKTLQQIIKTACDQGLLDEANDRAELAVSQLLNTAGYSNFVIETQPPPADACPVS